MRTSITAALAVATLACAPAAGHAANSVPTWDRHFLQDTAEGAHFEIDLGRVARRHGHTEEARRMGALMVKDHAGELHAVEAAGRRLGVALPKHPSIAQRHEISEVAAHSGAAFDRAYARLEIADHIMDIQVADGELMEGGVGRVQALARTYRRSYQRHLAGFRLLAKDVRAW